MSCAIRECLLSFRAKTKWKQKHNVSPVHLLMHRLPHPDRKPELFERWLSIVQDKLKETDSWKIFNNKRVCDHHFTPDQKVTGHRLIYMAVPTVNFDAIKERLQPAEKSSTSKTCSRDGLKSPEHEVKKIKTAQKALRKLRAQLTKSIKKQIKFRGATCCGI